MPASSNVPKRMNGMAISAPRAVLPPRGRRAAPRRRWRWRRARLVCISACTIAWGNEGAASPSRPVRDVSGLVTVTPEGASAGLAEPLDGLPGLLAELEWREMLHAATPGLTARLGTGRTISGYNGFDPTGPSLHVGSLVPIFGLLHLQRRGGRPVVIVGGATGMVGD